MTNNKRATPPPSCDAVRAAVEVIDNVITYIHHYCIITHPKSDKSGIEPEKRIKDSLERALSSLRALPADQGDEDAAKALEDMEPLRSYCPDHYDENEQCQIEAAMFLREHFEKIRAALQAKAKGG